MRAHPSIRRLLAVVGAALAACTMLLASAGPGVASSCDDDDIICGSDFAAVAGLELTGQVAYEPRDCVTGQLIVDWGDGSPLTDGVRTCDNPEDSAFGDTIAGTHTYAAAGTYTVQITDTGWIIGDSGHPTATATATVRPQAADLGLSVNAPGTVKNGANLIYAVDVSNGGVDPARNVVMIDTLPYGTVFQAVTATGWRCSTPPVGKAGGTVTCTVDPLASGAHVSSSIGVKVKAHLGRGVIVNAATVSSDTPDPISSNNSASVATTVVK